MSLRVQWGRIVSVCDTCGGCANVRRKDADACACATARSQKMEYADLPREPSNSNRALVVEQTHSAGAKSTLPHHPSKRELLARMGVRGVAVSPYEKVRFARCERRAKGAA